MARRVEAEDERRAATAELVKAAIAMLHSWARTIEEEWRDLSNAQVRWYQDTSDDVKLAIWNLAEGDEVDKSTAVLLREVKNNHQRNWG